MCPVNHGLPRIMERDKINDFFYFINKITPKANYLLIVIFSCFKKFFSGFRMKVNCHL